MLSKKHHGVKIIAEGQRRLAPDDLCAVVLSGSGGENKKGQKIKTEDSKQNIFLHLYISDKELFLDSTSKWEKEILMEPSNPSKKV